MDHSTCRPLIPPRTCGACNRRVAAHEIAPSDALCCTCHEKQRDAMRRTPRPDTSFLKKSR